MVAAAATQPDGCFHCGLPIPPGPSIRAKVAGVAEPVCCHGCRAVAELLDAQGLGEWYRFREGPTGQPPELPEDWLAELSWLEDEDPSEPAVLAGDATREVTLLVEGITCAACVWLIEQHLEGQRGIVKASVNLASQRVRIEWRPDRTRLRDAVTRLAEIGFRAHPDRPDTRAELEQSANRAALVRLGVAGLGAMNVMTYAVALYAGAFEGMEDGVRGLFRWLSLIVSTPVVAIGARPFFAGALRDLRLRRPGMDVPVALAIGGAYGVSAWATFRGEGEVYFDSACMFTFFLSLGRYLEMRARHRSAALSRRLMNAAPAHARRIEADGEHRIPAEALRVGDHLAVRPGEVLAADARIVAGAGRVEEALLTGEPWPRDVGPGDELVAGSVNAGSPLHVEATRVGSDTTLAALIALMERAQSEKPAVARLADRVAVLFVSVVLVLALGTAAYWSFAAPEQAIWTTLAVLIATCPCALSLATPAALAAATQGLASAGLLVTRGHVLEGLAAAERVVLDKTGTLTRGEPAVAGCHPLRTGYDRARCLALALRLERHSEHPLGRALVGAAGDAGIEAAPGPEPGEISSVAGAGMEAKLGGCRTRIGRPEWVAALAPEAPRIEPPEAASMTTWALLGDDAGPIAWLGFGDEPRLETKPALRELRALGLSIEMLSGDPSPAAAALAESLGLEVVCPAATPAKKLARVQQLQRAGERVIAVGDGVNDGPVLGAAEVGIAMGSGSDLTRLASDAVLLRDDLLLLPRAIWWSRRVRRVIRQNLVWATGYNLIALPLALTGQLPPWLAAAGMSASSLVVVLNATRLQRARGTAAWGATE